MRIIAEKLKKKGKLSLYTLLGPKRKAMTFPGTIYVAKLTIESDKVKAEFDARSYTSMLEALQKLDMLVFCLEAQETRDIVIGEPNDAG